MKKIKKIFKRKKEKDNYYIPEVSAPAPAFRDIDVSAPPAPPTPSTSSASYLNYEENVRKSVLNKFEPYNDDEYTKFNNMESTLTEYPTGAITQGSWSLSLDTLADGNWHLLGIRERRKRYFCGEAFLIQEQVPSWQERCRDLLNYDPPGNSEQKGNARLNAKVAVWKGNVHLLEVDCLIDDTGGELGDTLEIWNIKPKKNISNSWDVSALQIVSARRYPAKYVALVHPENRRQSIYQQLLYILQSKSVKTMVFCLPVNEKKAEAWIAAVKTWLLDKNNLETVDKIIFWRAPGDDEDDYLLSDDYILLSLMQHNFPLYRDVEGVLGPALPIEILRMDDKAVELYKTALEEGEEIDHSIRIMIIGHYGVGKTTLARRLLVEPVDIQARDSTNGIDVHICRCKVSLSDLTWHSLQPDEKSDTALKRLAKMIASHNTGEEDAPTPVDEEILKTTSAKTESSVGAVGGAKQTVDVQGDGMLNIREKLETQSINKPSDDKEEENEDTACIEEMKALVAEMTETGNFDPGEFASVSLWDFAGQYVFYTTHQMFLSPRAVYLLVTDISKHIGDVDMDDECYFDSSGPKQCTISECVDFWLNSIHTCSPDGQGDESTVPHVILVGTHADKLTEATITDDADFCQRGENCYRDKLASAYFEAVRNHLCEKPTRFHLADEDFDIDNTVIDSKLEDLKKKIVEVAQRQPHWGKRIPAKWLRLETALCGLKEKGLKIVDFVLIEKLNLAMAVPISTHEELELFLQFQHQSGNMLYFSESSLKEKVVLDSQWLVDALMSLIRAKMFCLRNPHVMGTWREFYRNGILRPQLLDAVWQKKRNPSFHDNRAHLLALMEKMNLISRPMLWHKDDAKPTKEEYYLAPGMLKNKTPEDLFSPSHGEDCKTTSILVFYFKGRFMPQAIFHRLLADCLSKWSLWQDGKSGLIFCDCGVFKIDHAHKLTIAFRDFTIQAFVTQYGRREKYPIEDICIAVRKFLDESLECVTGCIATSSLYELSIKCPENKSNSVDAIIPVSKFQEKKEVVCSCNDSTDPHVINSVDMLKYWFPCKTGCMIDGKTYHSCLSTERLRTMPTEKELGEISRRIGREYEQLGVELGLIIAEIDQIRIDKPLHIKDVIFNMLLTWEKKKKENATFSCLEDAMRAVRIDTMEVFKDIDRW